MYGNREERERLFREADEIERQGREAQREIDEMIRQREQARGSEDVDMENQELLEASTTPTSLEEPQFYTNMVDELTRWCGSIFKDRYRGSNGSFEPGFVYEW